VSIRWGTYVGLCLVLGTLGVLGDEARSSSRPAARGRARALSRTSYVYVYMYDESKTV
jgi:hypothetical protein